MTTLIMLNMMWMIVMMTGPMMVGMMIARIMEAIPKFYLYDH